MCCEMKWIETWVMIIVFGLSVNKKLMNKQMESLRCVTLMLVLKDNLSTGFSKEWTRISKSTRVT